MKKMKCFSFSTRRLAALVLATVAVLTLVTGCKVSDEGTPLANQAPTVQFTYSPTPDDTVNHYMNIRWSGNDADGYVAAFKLLVNGALITQTTATDTTMAFASPVDSGAAEQTILLVAIDNEGLESAPVSRRFYTVNYRPSVVFNEDGTIREGVTSSAGFRVTLSALDPNPSLFYYSVRIDDGAWSPWTRDSVILVAHPRLHASDLDQSTIGVDDDGDGRIDEERENGLDDDGDGRIDEDTIGLYPEGTTVVSNAGLTAGSHTLYAKVKDAGDAESDSISRSFTIDPSIRAVMDSTVTGLYGAAEPFYTDGSIYYNPAGNIETQMAFNAHFASADSGEVNAYRYQRADSAWSLWQTSATLTYPGLPAGEHRFRFEARDLAGNTTSNQVTFSLNLVVQQLTRRILLVDETQQRALTVEDSVDAFYAYLLEGYDVTTVEYVERGAYVSPYDLRDKGLLIWHSDDTDDIRLNEGRVIMREFLRRGGRVIITGRDWPKSLSDPSTVQAGDTARYFSEGSFGYDYLKLISARRPTTRQGSDGFMRGFDAVSPWTVSARIDTARLPIPGTWGDRLTGMWVFQQQGQCEVIGRTVVSDPSEPRQQYYNGRTTVYIYRLGFRVCAFGTPLYFIEREQAKTLMESLLPEMLTGLNEP